MPGTQNQFTNSPFSGQEYTLSYLTFGSANVNSEVESFDIDLTDGGEDVKTIARGYAGRVPGAAMCSLNFSGVMPYQPTDSSGVGTLNQGMLADGTTPLDQTMLNAHTNNYNMAPLQFIMSLGAPAVQQLIFKGNITSMKYAAGIGKATTFSGTATGTFAVFTPNVKTAVLV